MKGNNMYDVRIINDEVILFKDNVAVLNLESLRDDDYLIRYYLDDSSYVCIWSNNTIIWYNSNSKIHRDGDMPAYIINTGFMKYYYHGIQHRITGPATISNHGVRYYINGIHYTKNQFINELNSNYGTIFQQSA